MRNFGLNLKKNYLLLIIINLILFRVKVKILAWRKPPPPPQKKKGLDSRPLIHAIC